jgi:pectate lyase
MLASRADNAVEARRSNYWLCEDDTLLEKNHTPHREMRDLGEGRYSHWDNTLIFSATGNTNPNTNGRRYHLVARPPGRNHCSKATTRIILRRPFVRAGGFAFIAPLRAAARSQSDNAKHPRRSDYWLCEDETLLGRHHSEHAAIRDLGEGRYSHWDRALIFSASDNGDPNTNGRRYSLIKP